MSEVEHEKLRWALRYLLTHPLLSPQVVADEWEIEIEEAIEICSILCATLTINFSVKDPKKIEAVNKKCFKKLCSYEKVDAPTDICKGI